MYCATPDGSACGCGFECGHADGGGATLGQWAFGSDPFGPGGWFGFQPGGGPFGPPGAPGGTSFGFDVPDWLSGAWDSIRGELGEAARELGGDVVNWIQRRIGRETWERMPEASRREVIRQATVELTGGLAAPNVLPWVVAGGLGLVLLLRGR